MWTDRSKLDQGNTGAAVYWDDRNLDRLKEKSIFLRKNKEVLDAELWAVVKALEIAEKETENTREIPVTIFCDSQKALKAIQHSPFYKDNHFLRGIIYHTARQLQEQGHPIAFHWVPAHSGVTGNEKANLAARDRAARGGKQAERWSSLEYVKKNLIKAQATELTK